MGDDQIHLPLLEGIRIAVSFVCRHNPDAAVVGLGKLVHESVIESCFQAVGTVHLVSEIYGTCELFACVCIGTMSSAQKSAFLTKRCQTDDCQCDDGVSYSSLYFFCNFHRYLFVARCLPPDGPELMPPAAAPCPDGAPVEPFFPGNVQKGHEIPNLIARCELM